MTEVVVFNVLEHPDLLAQLQQIPKAYREGGEKGDDNDQTRLCEKWRGALPEHKKLFETFMESDPKLTPATLKKKSLCLDICASDALQSACSNWRAKKKKEQEKMAKSSLLLLPLLLLMFIVIIWLADESLFLFVAVANGGAEGLNAENAAKRSPLTLPDLSDVASEVGKMSISSKKSKSKQIMCNCKASIKSSESAKSTSNFSHAGNAFADGGRAVGRGPAACTVPFIDANVTKLTGSGPSAAVSNDCLGWCGGQLWHKCPHEN